MSKMKYIAVRISDEDNIKLVEMAKKENLSVSDLIRKNLGFTDSMKKSKRSKVSIKLDASKLDELKKMAEAKNISLEELIFSKFGEE